MSNYLQIVWGGHDGIYKLPFLWSIVWFTEWLMRFGRNNLRPWGIIMWEWESCFCVIFKGLWPTKGKGQQVQAPAQKYTLLGLSGTLRLLWFWSLNSFFSGSFQACSWKPQDGEIHGRTWDPIPAFGSSDRNLKRHRSSPLTMPPHSWKPATFLVCTHLKPSIYVSPEVSFLQIVTSWFILWIFTLKSA